MDNYFKSWLNYLKKHFIYFTTELPEKKEVILVKTFVLILLSAVSTKYYRSVRILNNRYYKW